MKGRVQLRLSPTDVLTVLAVAGMLSAYFIVLLAPAANLSQVSGDVVSAIYVASMSLALLAMYIDKVIVQEVSAHAGARRAEKRGRKDTSRKRSGKR